MNPGEGELVMSNDFGALLKKLRLQAGFGMRRFAELVDLKPSNLSAIENGHRNPPDEEAKLREIASTLGLSEASPEWIDLFDAAKRSGQVPADVRQVADRKPVPALLRAIDNCQLTDDQISKLISEIEGRYGEDVA